MFTGIVEQTGLLRSIRPQPGGKRIEIDLGPLAQGVKLGDSIAVSGVCLTASALSGAVAAFDVSAETLARSTLGRLQTGAAVNLERAMPADGRFGGHFVQGHIDGLGRIAAIRRQAAFAEFRIEAPAALLARMVEKGSVALDGISLTIASLDAAALTIAVIPATLAQTTWKDSRPGDAVNIETDILAKILLRQLKTLAGRDAALTLDKLQQMGFESP